ncbi:hypothetical protein [Carboxylicivirga caseinilyticus]|uniref:hypothetical protein n=1 Tax=Carboxylicivirga caseinilyticus TaxID=3417572 RepID=UPI003D3336CC|nr:hypothetical protein [Marinilabiliaceae bacterium A049]
MNKHRIIILLGLLIFSIVATKACELTLKVSGEAKETYHEGEVVIVEVKLVFTHRACPLAVKDTKFQYQGVKILAATEWHKVSDMEYTRKLKVQVLKPKNDKEKEPQITAIRSCDKEGGMGSIVIKRG